MYRHAPLSLQNIERSSCNLPKSTILRERCLKFHFQAPYQTKTADEETRLILAIFYAQMLPKEEFQHPILTQLPIRLCHNLGKMGHDTSYIRSPNSQKNAISCCDIFPTYKVTPSTSFSPSCHSQDPFSQTIPPAIPSPIPAIIPTIGIHPTPVGLAPAFSPVALTTKLPPAPFPNCAQLVL